MLTCLECQGRVPDPISHFFRLGTAGAELSISCTVPHSSRTAEANCKEMIPNVLLGPIRCKKSRGLGFNRVLPQRKKTKPDLGAMVEPKCCLQ